MIFSVRQREYHRAENGKDVVELLELRQRSWCRYFRRIRVSVGFNESELGAVICWIGWIWEHGPICIH